MTTLHKVTELTKKFALGFVLGVIGIIFLVVLIQYIRSILPKKVEPPTVIFGQLPAMTFPQNTLAKNFSYTINTVSGTLPVLPDKVAVYKTSKPEISLLSLDQAKDLSARNNFSGSPIQISDTVYQWQQVEPPLAKLSYDIISLNFTFITNYLSDPTAAVTSNLPDQAGAIVNAQNFFTNFGSNLTDTDLKKTQVSYYSIQNAALVPASSVSTAQAIRVDFYQKDIDKIPVYYPHYPKSNIYAILAGVNYPNSIAEAGYFHQSLLLDQNGTYPIKTMDEAFRELNENKAYIANYDGNKTNILIQDAYVAYFASDMLQDYLMPVIVFKGNDNFYAFVNAIKDEWITK